MTNGDQTDTIYRYMRDNLFPGYGFEAALATRTFEDDAPNFTPRISGVVDMRRGGYKLSILKSCDGNPASVQRQTFDYPQPVAGEGQLITTYQKNGSPIPSFAGEPLRVTLDQNDADEFAGKLWEALNEDNKVSLFVRAITFITKHYKVWLIIFLVMLFPAIHGNNNLKNYYNIDKSLPSTLDSNVANAKLQETFDMNNVHMVLLKKGLTSKEKTEMLDQIKDVDGVKWALGMDSFVGAAFPDTMIPSNLKKMLESDEYEMEFICSKYKTATDEVNNQIDEIQKIVKGYSPESMVIGEAPLTKDLQDVTDVDLKTVNTISILAIFIIIMVVFKSISLPFILVAVIEFAIFVNMSVPYYQGKEVVFVASIVIGCIQLGATVDYAILMTSRYQKERGLGKSKKESIAIAHKTSMKSIVISGCSFFAATFGVGLYTQVDMIGSITNLLSRGAVISTLVVLFILPAMFMIFDSLICHTSIGFAKKKPAKEKKQ